jgi:hypothetical protein
MEVSPGCYVLIGVLDKENRPLPQGIETMGCDSCEIRNLIYQYADYIDRGDLHSVAEMFREGRIVAAAGDGGESEIKGEEAIYGMYSAFTRIYADDGTPHTMHMTTNVIVDVDADGQGASARSYAVVMQAVDDFPLQPIIGVRYYDRFAKSGEQWRFSQRKIETLLAGDLSRHLLQSM